MKYEEACPQIVHLNIGGQKFSTSQATLMREPMSMLARMFSSGIISRKDEKGRVFIDRDPKHFRVILNYLRDGCCVLPTEEADIMELLQELDFYQLDGLRSVVLGEDCGQQPSAQHLRTCIAQQLKTDVQLRDATDLLVECAFGKGPFAERAQIPSRRAFIEVVVKESAFNPLFPQPHVQQRDEMLYVAFQQHIKFQSKMESKVYDCKHESHFIHEEGGLSYDPKVYGGSYHSRFHIKTYEVYRHHCIGQLSAERRRLREAALYIERKADAVQWALELYGFRDVRLAFHARQPELCDAPDSPPGSPTGRSLEVFQQHAHSPVLCNVRFDVSLSL